MLAKRLAYQSFLSTNEVSTIMPRICFVIIIIFLKEVNVKE